MVANRVWLWAVALISVAVFAGGCQQNRLREEREALFSQNRELQSELNRTRAALEGCESERGSMAAEIARLQAELDAARLAAAQATQQQYIPAAPAAPARSGFSDIEGVETVRAPGSITVRVPGDVLFASGKADVTTNSRRTLDQIARVLKTEHRGNRVRVEGHTDTDPIRRSKWNSNQELSEARARAVMNYLGTQGVDISRMTTVGHGSTRPRDTKAKSRRVEIVVLTN